MEEKDSERLHKFSQEVVKAPLSGLIAQCYGVIKANWLGPEEFNIRIFTDLFHRICIGNDGIIFLMWDEITEKYYSIHIPLVNIAVINEKPQPEYQTFVIAGPIYDIHFQFQSKVIEQGTAEELFDRTTDIRELVEFGWTDVNRQYAIPVNHISPYDLCAISNLHEIANRLAWFTLFMLDYKSPYNLVRTFGATLCDKYDVPALALFFNQSLQLFVTLINQPRDMEPFKKYVVRGYVDFHQEIPDTQMKSFIRNMYETHGIPIPDMENLIILNTAEQIQVKFITMTNVFINEV